MSTQQGEGKMRAAPDSELTVIRRILALLEPMSGTARARVVDYVVHRVDGGMPEPEPRPQDDSQIPLFPPQETRRAERAAAAG